VGQQQRREREKDIDAKRMDNVLIVVDDFEAAKAFFDVRATLAMMRTPDGQGIELDKFHTPNASRFGPVDAPEHAGHPSHHVRRR
jgi:hypothetical protein